MAGAARRAYGESVSFYEQLGGEAGLGPLIDRFVDRVFDDIMIGYLFQNVDRARVKRMEFAFAARHLGADAPYPGKGMQEAHAPHRILAGHFERRLKILEEVLEEVGAPVAVREHWLELNRSLRAQITTDADCEAGSALPRVIAPEGTP